VDQKKIIGWILAVSAVNWGLVGLFQTNIVTMIFGVNGILTTLVYTVIGLAGGYKVYMLLTAKKGK
jgi:uncharacterized membrane protein YuzA (DUF378 family)